jgi:hypothetical protein
MEDVRSDYAGRMCCRKIDGASKSATGRGAPGSALILAPAIAIWDSEAAQIVGGNKMKKASHILELWRRQDSMWELSTLKIDLKSN